MMLTTKNNDHRRDVDLVGLGLDDNPRGYPANNAVYERATALEATFT